LGFELTKRVKIPVSETLIQMYSSFCGCLLLLVLVKNKIASIYKYI
jgi:hypothetical protein